ncbi:hypothetical protein CTAYLR_008655 [Chrysophaeum taylorii]|uniref:DUF547 domain-containing protein n=1 Tax=Chrysophaeum taylorii TaxID=2483200 RepID=A0AAD7XHX5_9STRA|nr:hypothetical protein CTAYLR_008655 [Chrysophaeum taylorii]
MITLLLAGSLLWLEDAYLKPYYALEKMLASRSIPAVPSTATLQRFDDPAVIANQGERVDHALWDSVLRAHVVDGLVDYEGMAADPRLGEYLDLIAAVDADKLGPLEKLALYMNAYNALCCRVITTRKPEKSILDLSTKTTQIWDQPVGSVAGVEVSLNDVEHTFLRFQWDEPAIHACIVCASSSCPSLASFAFTGDHTLPDVMRSRLAAFFSDETKGLKLDPQRDVATFSRILLWFADDFASGGGPVRFARSAAPEPAALFDSMSPHPRLRYFDYDWALNNQRP